MDGIEEKLRKAGAKPARREGEREGRWVLLDYLDIVIHVQHADERAYYSLERLWKDCPQIQLPEPVGRVLRVGRRSYALTGGTCCAAPERWLGSRWRERRRSAAAEPVATPDSGCRLVLWRHGQTAWNAERRFQGQSDIPLDDGREQQAERAARLLAALRPDTIISSDLGRATATAAPLARLTALTVHWRRTSGNGTAVRGRA